jgi:hypothetical protein
VGEEKEEELWQPLSEKKDRHEKQVWDDVDAGEQQRPRQISTCWWE